MRTNITGMSGTVCHHDHPHRHNFPSFPFSLKTSLSVHDVFHFPHYSSFLRGLHEQTHTRFRGCVCLHQCVSWVWSLPFGTDVILSVWGIRTGHFVGVVLKRTQLRCPELNCCWCYAVHVCMPWNPSHTWLYLWFSLIYRVLYLPKSLFTAQFS